MVDRISLMSFQLLCNLYIQHPKADHQKSRKDGGSDSGRNGMHSPRDGCSQAEEPPKNPRKHLPERESAANTRQAQTA